MYLGKRVPSGNSMAPSVLPKTKPLFLRSVPEEALKQEDISPCSLVQLWNVFSVGWKQLIPFSVLIRICPSDSGSMV